MDFLTLNGLSVPVASWENVPDAVGDAGRSFSGGYLSTRRATKRHWQLTTTPLESDFANLLVTILEGKGDGWSFETDTYSSKGNPLSGTLTSSISTAAYAFGSKSLSLSGTGGIASQAIAIRPNRAYALLARVKSSGTFRLYAQEADALDHYTDATPYAELSSANKWQILAFSHISAATTVKLALTLSLHNATGNTYVDALTYWPVALSDALITQINRSGTPFVYQPRMQVGGCIVTPETVLCEGDNVKATGVQMVEKGYRVTKQTLDFDLLEV